jgi:RNA polymerase sigma-70 factor (ECF subfamily)
MYRWALIHTMEGDAAEDVTQRALLRFTGALSSFRGESALDTWVFTIVRSAAADWRRSERRRGAMMARHHAIASPRHDAQPEARDAGLIAIVRNQLIHLPSRQREVFDLVDLQGRTAQEAAALLSMNPATARVHLMRARRTIRSRLLAEHPSLVEHMT